MDAVWAALAEPNRRTIVERLATGERTAGELGEGLDLTQPAVSKHLRLLREAGLVSAEPRGQQRVYRLRVDSFEQIEAWAQHIRQFWAQRRDAPDTEIAREQRARKDTP